MTSGLFNPSVKNLLPLANEWKALQTFTKSSLGATTAPILKLRNISPAASGAQQVSPSVELEAQGWSTNSGGASKSIKFDEHVLPVQGSVNPSAIYKKRFSIAGGAFSDLLELYTTIQDGLSYPSLKMYGMIESVVNNSSTISTLQNFLLTNPSGSKTNIGFKFGSTIKAGFGIDASGTIDYRGLMHTFFIGNTAESSSQVVQIYSGGIYINGGSYNTGAVTA